MYFLLKFCGACLENNTNLLPVSKSSDVDMKLSQCLKEVDWSLVQQFYICTSCRLKLDIAYEFRKTCLKSLGTLKSYITLLKNEGGNARNNLIVHANPTDISTELLKDYKLKNTINPNVVLPSPNGAVIPGTNIILNPFSFYNVLPANTMVTMIQQPGTSFHSPSKLSTSSNPPINLQSVEQANDSNIFNPMPQLLILNNLPPSKESQINSTRSVQDILNTTESEELSVSLDPMVIFNMSNDECDSSMHRELKPVDTEYINGNDSMYTCFKCGVVYNDPKQLKAHRKFDKTCSTNYPKVPKSAECPKCYRSFCSKQYLEKHISHCGIKKSRKQRHKKPMCYMQPTFNETNSIEEETDQLENCIATEDPLDISSISSSEVNNEECSLKAIKVELDLEKMEVEPPKEDQNASEIASSVTDIKSDIETEELLCGFCMRTYNCSEHLIQHLSCTHKDLIPFRCQFCHEKFKSGVLLKEHLPSHYNYFICSNCNESFTDVRDMRVHIFLKHPMEEIARCVSCNREFRTYRSIVEHSELHLKNLLFECHACNEKYKTIDDLQNHLCIHIANRDIPSVS